MDVWETRTRGEKVMVMEGGQMINSNGVRITELCIANYLVITNIKLRQWCDMRKYHVFLIIFFSNEFYTFLIL